MKKTGRLTCSLSKVWGIQPCRLQKFNLFHNWSCQYFSVSQFHYNKCWCQISSTLYLVKFYPVILTDPVVSSCMFWFRLDLSFLQQYMWRTTWLWSAPRKFLGENRKAKGMEGDTETSDIKDEHITHTFPTLTTSPSHLETL